MEWIEFLRNGIVRRDQWVSNLSEHYCIYKDYMCKEFVKDFLDEREKILGNNRYKMFINIIQEKGEPGTVGKVMLYSKDKLIHQATLKVKIMDDNDCIVAGIISRMYCWNCVYVDTLWVSESQRGNGLGTQLLREVEREAKSKGAYLIHLDTFDFQAKDFYLMHGYNIFGQLENCPEGHCRYYLKKELI